MLTHKGTKELTTKRLKLRRFTVEDAQDMFNNWANDAEVTKFMRWPPHATLDVTRELLSKWVEEYEKSDYYSWAIEYNGRLIGSIGAPSIKERDERTGIGYCIARDCWNKGITTEALEAVCNYLFDEVGFNRLEIRHATENPASGKVAQKCGFIPEGIMRESFRSSRGVFCDLVMLGRLKSDRN
jgi:ribosomal-protein-alanine N-acetyltransferase